MSAVCPAGHTSSSEDYCDVCGMPIDQSMVTPDSPPPPPDPPTQAPAGQACPNCSTVNVPDALFCENCGYDFTTQSMPRPVVPPQPSQDGEVTPSAASDEQEIFDWVAEVWIDPAWYELQDSPDPLPSPGLPEVIPLRGRSLLVGRTSRSRNIHPEIDIQSDTGVSRRQAQLTTDGRRWWVEDLESANGTFVAPASGVLPEDPIPVGVKRELAADDRVYVGAWTRLVIRPATDEERDTLG
jgi:FHA domain-containing protein